MLSLLISCSGCATSITFLDGRRIDMGTVYPATKLDGWCWKETVPENWRNKNYGSVLGMTTIVGLDYPFSIIFDTILLPYDIFINRK